jgi:hypothetical protein
LRSFPWKKADELKSSSGSLADELEFAYMKEKHENEMKVMNIKMERIESRESKRTIHLKKLKELADKRHHELDKLKDSIKQLKKKQRCPYEWKCDRIFCSLDHTYLYRKLKQDLDPVQSTSTCSSNALCEICGKFLLGDMKKHIVEDHESIELQCEQTFDSTQEVERHKVSTVEIEKSDMKFS